MHSSEIICTKNSVGHPLEKASSELVEILSENYMIDGGRPLRILDQILDQYRGVQHGVSMYFGSAQPLNRDHLKRIKELTKCTNTPGYLITSAGEA